MDKSSGSKLKFGVLKTRNSKPKTKEKPKTKVPWFDGLRNPFFNVKKSDKVEKDKADTNKSEKERMETAKKEPNVKEKVKVETVKVDGDKDANSILKLLKLAKNKATIVTKNKLVENVKNVHPPDKPFKTPRKKVCSMEGCSFCTAEKCRICPNCVDISRHNKCVRQLCPRMNKKYQKKTPSVDSNVVVSELFSSNVNQSENFMDDVFMEVSDIESMDIEGMKVIQLEYIDAGNTDAGQPRLMEEQFVDLGYSEVSVDAFVNAEQNKIVNSDTTSSDDPRTHFMEPETESELSNKESVPVTENYRCFECGRVFTYLANLKNHNLAGCKVSREQSVKCTSCNIDVRKSSLVRHMKTHQTRTFPCTQCKKRFKTENKLENHMSTHLLKTCSLCDKVFKRPFLLRKHMASDHVGADREVKNKCDICSCVFNRPWRLINHIKKAHGLIIESQPKTYRCKHCGKPLQTNRELKDHLRAEHGDLAFKCNICARTIFTKQAFQKHMINHSDQDLESQLIQSDKSNQRVTNDSETSEKELIHPINNSMPEVSAGKCRVIQENIKVCGRIRQNINMLDLENKSDDDDTFEPPKGIDQHKPVSILFNIDFAIFPRFETRQF